VHTLHNVKAEGVVMKRIAVLGSGGDAPGMNACLRAVVRSAVHRDLEVMGVRDGYVGLIAGEMHPLGRHDVSNIIQRGGVFLGTARSQEFMTPEGRAKAAAALRQNGVDGLLALGGDGTLRGAMALNSECGTPVVVVPCTIDNDAPGTDLAIGFDTAVNTALEAVDRIRDTAEATERVFFVEVMGRECGALALEVGIAAGADAILVPEVEFDRQDLLDHLNRAIARHSRSLIVVVAEGEVAGGAFAIAEQVRPVLQRECRVTVLGHVQRGGSPTGADRVLATRLSVAAVAALVEGRGNCLVGQKGREVVATPFAELEPQAKKAPLALLELIDDLA
jgi:6-phosphofructokinase 1